MRPECWKVVPAVRITRNFTPFQNKNQHSGWKSKRLDSASGNL